MKYIVLSTILWSVAGAILVDQVGNKIVRRGKVWEQVCLTVAGGPLVWVLMAIVMIGNWAWKERS